jgi:hypothetical protein
MLDAAGLLLTAWSAWFVARRWTGSSAAGLVAGALVGFNVHVLTRLAHLAATHLWGLPLTLYFADALVQQPRVRPAVWLALIVAATAGTSLYSLALCVVILAAVAIAGVPRWRGLLVMAAAAAAGLALATPVLLPYLEMARAGHSRPIEMVADFSATLPGYVTSTSWLHGWWSRAKTNDVDVFFAGGTALVLAAIGIARTRSIVIDSRRRTITLIVLAGAGVLLSLGPATPIYRGLYDALPPLRGIRAAARFGMLALLAVAFAASFGIAWLERVKRVRPALLASLAIAAVTMEAWQGPVRTMAGAQRAPAIYGWLADAPANAVLVEVPFFPGHAAFENGEYVFNATGHWRPVMNGYSGFTPMSYRRRADVFWRFPEPGVVEAMKSEGATHIMVHLERFGRGAADVSRVVDTSPDLRLVAADREGHRLYEIRAP